MRTSWTLFGIFVFILGVLWNRATILTNMGAFVGSTAIILFASHWLARFVWKKLLVRQISSEGKAVLIAGCDTGFGHALVYRLHRDGFLVFAGCLDSRGPGANELRKLANVRVLQLDITDEDQVEDALKKIKQQLGTTVLWAVVANAGIASTGLLEWLTMSSIRKVFEVNVFGTLRVVKKFLPMVKNSKGRMIVVTSPFGHITVPLVVPYCMSKHALVSMVNGLRRECQGKGVDVVSIEPCAYKTAITSMHGLYDAAKGELEKQIPEVIADYSEEDIKRWVHTAEVLHDTTCRNDLDEVVNPMVQAITETHPKTTYTSPFRLGSLLFYLPRVLPTEFGDTIVAGSSKLASFLPSTCQTVEKNN